MHLAFVSAVGNSARCGRPGVPAAALRDPGNPSEYKYTKDGPFSTSASAIEGWCQSFSPDGKHMVRIRVTYPSTATYGREQEVDDSFPIVAMLNGFLVRRVDEWWKTVREG